MTRRSVIIKEEMSDRPCHDGVQIFYINVVGGNHEAANYLWELYYGGWAAPNIYFLGFTGCVRFGGVRIAGLSGIYKQVGHMVRHQQALKPKFVLLATLF